MRQSVFDLLYNSVRAYDDYFNLKKYVVRTIGFSGYQKVTSTLRMVTYGTITGSWDV